MANYGLPYMGSKNRIAEKIINLLPSAENFYDLFSGGGSITHFAIKSGKYKNFYVNDINELLPKAFKNSIYGEKTDSVVFDKYGNYNWISRDNFYRYKDTDVFVKICYSFGNNGRDYIYKPTDEPIKKAMHYALLYNDFSLLHEIGIDASSLSRYNNFKDKYLALKNIISYHFFGHEYNGSSSICRLQHIEAINRVKRMKLIDYKPNIIISSESYENIKIKPNSVVYCDIPYRNTHSYSTNSFDYDRFYRWVLSQTQPVFISEYYMPEKYFKPIAEIGKVSSYSANSNNKKTVEKLFIPK